MDVTTIAAVAGSVAGVGGAAVAMGLTIGRPLRKLVRDNAEFREDWYGTAARPGRDPEPGVMERLRKIEKELHPNGGSTLRDAVNRMEARFEDHLKSPHGQPPT